MRLLVERRRQLVERDVGIARRELREQYSIDRIGEGVGADAFGRWLNITPVVQKHADQLALGPHADRAVIQPPVGATDGRTSPARRRAMALRRRPAARRVAGRVDRRRAAASGRQLALEHLARHAGELRSCARRTGRASAGPT